MVRVGNFEKVSYGQFAASVQNAITQAVEGNTALIFDKSLTEIYEDIVLPTRSTGGSAGYDFRTPFGFELDSGEEIVIPTGIRAKIVNGWMLTCVPRSGLGFKYKVRLANTVGIIDSDYYDSDNEGHIMIKLVNGGDKQLKINAGDKFVQGIFIPYGITTDDNATEVRNGGMGSTGR